MSQYSSELFASIGVKSHGSIIFSDNESNRAEFIRIPVDASVMHVKEFLLQGCDQRPPLVLSFTGGAKRYVMGPKLLRALRRAILKVTRTTGAWIMTGGMSTGVMKFIGEIIQITTDRSRPIHAIGITAWGCVAGGEQLDIHGTNVNYTVSYSKQLGESPLEPNHTEFIFVDDGTKRKYGADVVFRTELELAISDSIPVVLIVIEGGPNTIRTVHQTVVHNNIPVVFLEETGPCCDLFTKAYYLYNQYCSKFNLSPQFPPLDPAVASNLHVELKNTLRKELKDQLEIFQTAESEPDYFEIVYECLHTQMHLLNVISVNSEDLVETDIDLIILQAVLKACDSDSHKTNNQRKHEQLHLALKWKRVDIVKKYIMLHDQDWENIDLNDIFELALEQNQMDFVKLILIYRPSLADTFRNNEKLLSLHETNMKEEAGCTKSSTYKDSIGSSDITNAYSTVKQDCGNLTCATSDTDPNNGEERDGKED